MLISDLDYLDAIADSDPSKVVTGGFFHPSRLPFKLIFVFNKKFKQDIFTGTSSGGYVANNDDKIVGVFASSNISSSNL